MARSVVFHRYSSTNITDWDGIDEILWHPWSKIQIIIKYVTSSEIVILMNKMFTKIYTNDFLIFKRSKWHLLIKILFSIIWNYFVKEIWECNIHFLYFCCEQFDVVFPDLEVFPAHQVFYFLFLVQIVNYEPS